MATRMGILVLLMLMAEKVLEVDVPLWALIVLPLLCVAFDMVTDKR